MSKFVIVSLKNCVQFDEDAACKTQLMKLSFWRPYGEGYTFNPFDAGIFSLKGLDRCSLSLHDIVLPMSFFKDGLMFPGDAENGKAGGKYMPELPSMTRRLK